MSNSLPPRPQAPAFFNKLRQQSEELAADEARENRTAAVVNSGTAASTQTVIKENTMTNAPTNPFTNAAAVAHEQAAVDQANQEAAAAAAAAAADDDGDSDDALPRGAGLIDYRTGDNELPKTAVSEAEAKQLANSLDGMDLTVTLPVTSKEPWINNKGELRLNKAGEPMLRKVTTPTPVYMVMAGETGLSWLLDETYCVELVAEQLLHRVTTQLKAQGVALKKGMVFTADWLMKHFGADSVQDAINGELRPWSAKKQTAASAAAIQQMCSTITDAETIISMYDFAEQRLTKYLKFVNKKAANSAIASQLAPLVKSKSKWEQYVKRCEKAEKEGKATPKAPVIRGLIGESPKSVQAVAALVLRLVEQRDSVHGQLEAGINIPKNFTPEDVQVYLAETAEHQMTMQAVACWLNGVATAMKDAEQKALRKYAAASEGGEEAIFM